MISHSNYREMKTEQGGVGGLEVADVRDACVLSVEVTCSKP